MQKGHQIQLNLYCHSIHRVLKEDYGDELFWKEKFHAANGKAQAYTQGALLFSLLSLRGAGERGRIFFHLSLVPNLFPLCSFQVPNGFPICFSTCSPQHLTSTPCALTKVVLLSPVWVSQRGGTLYFKIKPSIVGTLHKKNLSDRPLKLPCCKTPKKPWDALQLIRSWVSSQLFLFFKKGAILIGPSAIFLEHWACPQMEAPVWTPVAKYKEMCSHGFHLLSLYTWELNFGQTICDKTQVLLEAS